MGDVVDLAVTRLPDSTLSAREAMMTIRCHYFATQPQQHWCGCTRGVPSLPRVGLARQTGPGNLV